ncbi:MAG: rhomboid family intramembrane serine protease [bacterium]
MIIPIGNTGSVRRLPFATLSLIVIMCIVFFAMQSSVNSGNSDLYGAYNDYMNFVAQNMEMKGMDSFDSEELAMEMEHPSVEDGDSLYLSIIEAKTALDEASASHPFSKLGVSKSNLSVLTLLTSMFVHSDIFHLVGNLWFLFLLGFNIEDIYGRRNYLIFYLLSGIVSSLLFVASSSDANISLIGASGAISGVMGAFLVKLYRTKIKFFYWFLPVKPLFGTFSIYAGFCLPLWFMQQIVESASNATSGIAFIAHIGGFLFGAVTAILLTATKIEERFISPKVEESSNLLGMNNEEQKGVEAYMENDFKKAKSLLLSNFQKKRTFSSFVPLFASLAKTKENDLARKTMDIYLNELRFKNERGKIIEIFEDVKEAGVFETASNTSKMIFARALKSGGFFESAGEIIKNLCEKEIYTVTGYKALIAAYEENIEFEGMDSLAEEFVKNSNIEMEDLRKTLSRRMNEQR